jgi:hypothetical protein
MRGGAGEASTAPARASSLPEPEPEPAAAAQAGAAALTSGRRRSRWPEAAGAGAILLSLALAGGWAVSGWHYRSTPVRTTRDEVAERPGEPAREQPPQGQADGRTSPTEGKRAGVGSSVPSEPAPASQQAVGAKELRRAGPGSQPQPAVSDASLAFRGPVYNDTLRRGGQLSLVIRRQQPAGAVTVRFEAWAGLLGSGELTGQLSADGRLRASGQLMVGRNVFSCELSATIVGEQLTGSARFVRVGGTGSAAHSSFALSRS